MVNALHCAAQGNAPVSVAFFLRIGFDIDSLTRAGSTPLHWAAFNGADLALMYLIKEGAALNAVDSKGLTPIHMAVQQAEQICSTRCIRALLLAGAMPHLRDDEDKLPADYLADFDMFMPIKREFAQEIADLLEKDESNETRAQ